MQQLTQLVNADIQRSRRRETSHKEVSQIDYARAVRTLRMASRDVETESSELAYTCRLARKRIQRARLVKKTSLALKSRLVSQEVDD